MKVESRANSKLEKNYIYFLINVHLNQYPSDGINGSMKTNINNCHDGVSLHSIRSFVLSFALPLLQ